MTLPQVAVIVSLAIVPTCALAEGAGAERQATPVAIYLSFDGEHSGRAVEAMKQEVQALTKTSGLRLHWRLLDSPRGDETFCDLMVVKFHGRCSMEGIRPLFNELGPEAEGSALGSTKTANGRVL